MKIEDGTGTGRKTKVDIFNRLMTRASCSDAFDFAVTRGRGFLAFSGIVNLTSDTESGILYLKNNGDNSIKIEKSILQIGASDGTGDVNTVSYINPTGGTLITAETAASVANLNLSSARDFDGDTYKGAEGATITGGSSAPDIFTSPGRYELKAFFIVQKGASIAISVTPPTGNTSMDVNFQTFIYEIEE